jgi:hypothetical protein
MHRVQRLPADAETITITKTVFDDLVLVAQAASQVQHSGCQPAEMIIECKNNEYQVSVRNKYIPEFSVSKSNLLEAISAAQRQFGAEREKLLN